VLLGALALYLAAAVACAAAPSLEWLIVARLFQGFGACAGPVIARAIVRDVYDPLRGARVLSLAMLGMSLGPITGAMAGGGVVFAFHWRGVFVVLSILGALLLLATTAVLAETSTSAGHPSTVASPVHDYRMLVTDRRFLAYVLTLAASSVGLFAWIAGSPFVLMTVFGLPAYLYGTAYAAVNVGQLGGASLSARLVVRLGIDRSIVVGLALYLAGGLTLAALLFGGARHPLAVIVPMAVFQFGNGLVMPNTVAGAIAPFPRAAGAASALAGFIQTGTGALSGVVLGRLHDGSAKPMALLIGVSAVAAALTFRLMVPRHGRHKSTRWESRV
jgi:DHA1 family bicyclomycin/chloramphenicol resistance-like MFS transporter